MNATTGLAQSVQVRLVRHARAIGADPNLVLARYAAERFLYRLSRSPYAERFVLKGALLLLVWFGETFRPTRDADLLGFGDLSEQSLTAIFRECCAMEVEPDGLAFDPAAITVVAIRPEDAYGGERVTVRARLGSARIRVQVDVGIGDAVDPPAEWLDYPSLLDLPRPRLRAYRPETVVAEKLHAMVALGAANSRMRDFFDVHALKWTARMESGHTPDKKVESYWRGGDIPWVSLADTGQLREVDYIADTVVRTTADGIANSSAHVLPPGTVVFSRDATVGLCAITGADMAVSQHFIGWVCSRDLDPEYLLFVLRSMTHELERITMGATVRTIGMPEVRSLVMPIPPKEEQEEIVRYVRSHRLEIDQLVVKVGDALDRLKELRAALIAATVTGKIDVREEAVA